MAENYQPIKREFNFRGKKIEELKQLNVREFAKYLKSRGRRTILRQFNNIEDFVSRAKIKLSKKKQIKNHKRDLIIVPEMVGMKIHIHRGNGFTPIDIIPEMMGHRLGEFAPTRSRINHGNAGVGATKGSKSKSKK